MATLEREHLEQLRWAPEQPVFVTQDGRRARRLRLVAVGVVVLAVIWLGSLAAGTLGFGSLPGLPSPLARLTGFTDDKAKPPAGRDPQTSRPAEENASRTAPLIADKAGRPTAQVTATRTARNRARGAAAGRRSDKQARRSPASQAQPLPLSAKQGWARHGRPAPRGQARRLQPTLPPPAKTPPGQVRKALLPPPPPPPPGNGHGGGNKPY